MRASFLRIMTSIMLSLAEIRRLHKDLIVGLQHVELFARLDELINEIFLTCLTFIELFLNLFTIFIFFI